MHKQTLRQFVNTVTPSRISIGEVATMSGYTRQWLAFLLEDGQYDKLTHIIERAVEKVAFIHGEKDASLAALIFDMFEVLNAYESGKVADIAFTFNRLEKARKDFNPDRSSKDHTKIMLAYDLLVGCSLKQVEEAVRMLLMGEEYDLSENVLKDIETEWHPVGYRG